MIRLEEGRHGCLHDELSRQTCRRWEVTGHESEQQQRHSGHPHQEAGGGSEAEAGIGVGNGDGVEESGGP